jgi:internalin A
MEKQKDKDMNNNIITISSIIDLRNMYEIIDIDNNFKNINDDSIQDLIVRTQNLNDKVDNILLFDFETSKNSITITKIQELNEIEESEYLNVQVVELEKMCFEEIPQKIFSLTNLKILNLSHNLIKEIPDSIGDLINLTELYLADNQIYKISDSIDKLKNLTRIILSNNQIYKLPKSFYNLKKLELLNIVCNNLCNLSKKLSNMSNLEYLYLRSNKLKYIPECIKNISSCKIYLNSYECIDNLSNKCEYLEIDDLNEPLNNLPISLKEIRLYLPKKIKIKLPFNCKLYVDDILIE